MQEPPILVCNNLPQNIFQRRIVFLKTEIKIYFSHVASAIQKKINHSLKRSTVPVKLFCLSLSLSNFASPRGQAEGEWS